MAYDVPDKIVARRKLDGSPPIIDAGKENDGVGDAVGDTSMFVFLWAGRRESRLARGLRHGLQVTSQQ